MSIIEINNKFAYFKTEESFNKATGNTGTTGYTINPANKTIYIADTGKIMAGGNTFVTGKRDCIKSFQNGVYNPSGMNIIMNSYGNKGEDSSVTIPIQSATTETAGVMTSQQVKDLNSAWNVLNNQFLSFSSSINPQYMFANQTYNNAVSLTALFDGNSITAGDVSYNIRVLSKNSTEVINKSYNDVSKVSTSITLTPTYTSSSQNEYYIVYFSCTYKGITKTQKYTCNSCGHIYYGGYSGSTITSADAQNLNTFSSPRVPSGGNYSFSTNLNDYAYFIFPSTNGEVLSYNLSSIIDTSNLNSPVDFTLETYNLSINGLNYNIYKTKDKLIKGSWTWTLS